MERRDSSSLAWRTKGEEKRGRMHTFPHFSPFRGGKETKLEIGYLALPRREGGGGGEEERGKKKIHTSGKGRRRRRLNPFYPSCGLQGPHKKSC